MDMFLGRGDLGRCDVLCQIWVRQPHDGFVAGRGEMVVARIDAANGTYFWAR